MSTRLLRRACVLAFALGAWCAAPSSAQDLDGLLGRVVSEVRVVSGGQAVRDAQLEGLIAVRAGEALRMDAVRETIVHAMGLGRYLDVRVLGRTGRATRQGRHRPRAALERRGAWCSAATWA